MFMIQSFKLFVPLNKACCNRIFDDFPLIERQGCKLTLINEIGYSNIQYHTSVVGIVVNMLGSRKLFLCKDSMKNNAKLVEFDNTLLQSDLCRIFIDKIST